MSKVLIVDDERSIRYTLSEFLLREHYEVQTAEDAQSALAILEHQEQDIIITDIIMPRTSGIELLQVLRDKYEDTQVIIMTGEPTVDTAIAAVRAGAQEYLAKPIAKESLLKAVRQAAQVKALINEKRALEVSNREHQRNLEELVQTRTEALQKTMQSVVSLLSAVVEMRDPYTAGHQRRVGNLAASIAESLGWSAERIDSIRVVGYIHDIGKIVIPAEILAKPGLLSKPEMEIIRVHPAQGNDILSAVDLPGNIAETVYQHHERLDGSGYPRGLKGSEISDEAHVIIVADVVEAMMSHRPYRPALGIERALAEVQKNSGILYKPEVVTACVRLFHQKKYSIDNKEVKVNFPI